MKDLGFVLTGWLGTAALIGAYAVGLFRRSRRSVLALEESEAT